MLLENASQQHLLQRRKAILQHFNPQLKSLVQDADFAEAPPYLFGTNFGKLAKEKLEAAALIQKPKSPRIFRSATPRNSAPGAIGVATTPPKALAEEGCTTVGVQEAPHPATTGTNKVNVHMHNLNVQKMLSCTPVLSLPQSPAQHLQVLMSRLDQIDCQSLTRRVLQLEYTDTGQVGSANSARVYDRFYPDTLPILPTPTDSNITS